MAIERDNPRLSVGRQCELLGLGRSSLYYRPGRDESYNEHLMQLIDEQYTKTPFYGIPRMTVFQGLSDGGRGEAGTGPIF